MAKFSSVSLHHLLVLFFIVTAISSCCYASVDERKVYIVYMGSLPEGDYSPTAHHATILEEVLEGSSVADALVSSYKRSFNGFAAKLTESERQRLASRGEVVSIFPSRTLQLQTTRSWSFMGLLETNKHNHSIESDTIIGVIDSGIWIDSPSFSDVGFSPPPKKWKGVCDGGANFTCNNKVIGARNYLTVETITDEIGHGSHTASTAAGNSVKGASFFGVGTGVARGAVPSARIAVYKVCGAINGCPDNAILSAFDDAIADGVDILTVSLGTAAPHLLTEDSLAIGAFHAMTKNILTMQSGGNNGPKEASVSSVAPWLFTVAASNTDRRFISKVVLANGKEFNGSAVNSFSLKAKDYPLVFGKDAGTQCDEGAIRSCTEDCLDTQLVEGKIVLCTRALGFNVAFAAGAAGAIVQYDTDHSNVVPFPASMLSTDDFESVVAYYRSTKNARANILKSVGVKVGSPPKVASFSSRGPNAVLADILKPDISAPGVDILAGYSMIAPPSRGGDSRETKYSVLSGTSMACPHVAGVAAYVKTFHPDWSTSAIKSAIMTTAWPMNNTEEPFRGILGGTLGYEFAYGAGHIDPVKAIDPGLVYETTKDGYIKMLCDIGLDQADVRKISGDKSSCRNGSKKSLSLARELNYPSMTAYLDTASTPVSVHFTRTVTNVGSPRSVYKSKVTNNEKEFKIAVEPSTLSFKSIGEKKTFNVTVTSSTDLTGMLSASLVWSDGVHTVRSPIVLYTM